jgi:hypothetical protein
MSETFIIGGCRTPVVLLPDGRLELARAGVHDHLSIS